MAARKSMKAMKAMKSSREAMKKAMKSSRKAMKKSPKAMKKVMKSVLAEKKPDETEQFHHGFFGNNWYMGPRGQWWTCP